MYEYEWNTTKSGITDIEDMKKKAVMTSGNLPLVVDMIVYRSSVFMEDDEIKKYIDKINGMYVQCKKKFLLRICGNLVNDIETLNQKILYAYNCLNGSYPILVQLSFERLILLSRLSNTAFLQPKIFPSLKMYLRKGDERQCMDDIDQVLLSMKEFVGIKVIITLSIEYPFPSLSEILANLRKHSGFVKLIEITLERSPSKIVESVNTSKSTGSVKVDTYTGSVDPFEAIEHISNESGDISTDDFFPVSMASVFEPFIDLMGIGNFSIRPSSLCTFGTCLINHEDIQSVPVSKFINVYQFYKELKPLIPEIVLKGVGFFSGRAIKKILKRTSLVKLPNILSIVRQKSKANLVNKFIDHLQYIIIHNHMDIAVFDMVRRCQCSSVKMEDNKLISTCTGCL